MRDILFKGKGKEGEGWKEGYYWFCRDTLLCFATAEEQEKNEHHYILFDGFCDWNMTMPHYRLEIIPETLCRYIGLTDKNGCRIWEGDIISIGDRAIPYVVEWYDTGFMGKASAGDRIGLLHWSDRIEVIGNIFDNPELIRN